MKKDIVSSLFWLSFAIYYTAQSYRLGLGQWGMPGPGYFPFGAGLVFGMLALCVTVSAFRKSPAGERAKETPERLRWENVALILTGMLAYILLFKKAGFVIATFLLVFFFIRVIARQRWFQSFLAAVSITIAFHVFFNILLNAQLPMGLLKF
jgi:putative tricarboxylic transport membrane protein